MIKSFNETVRYIESVLDSEIDEKKVATISSYSYPMFGRLFSVLTDMTLSEYIRFRKLTKAAKEINETNERIIDIAVKYGYESSDSFTNAFKNFHHTTPTEVRKGGAYRVLSPVQLALSVTGGKHMKSAIEAKFGVVITDEKLNYAIHLQNEIRGLQRKLYEMRMGSVIKVSGADVLTAILAGFSMGMFGTYVITVLFVRRGLPIVAAIALGLVICVGIGFLVDFFIIRRTKKVDGSGKEIITLGLMMVFVGITPMVNGAGGIGGRKITFIHYDDEFDPVKGKSYLQQLVEDDKVFAIVGHFGTPVVSATINDLKAYGIPSVYFATGIGQLYAEKATTNEEGYNIFPVQPIYTTEGQIMMGLPIPEAYGGSGLDQMGYVLAVEELAKVCATTSIILSAHTSLCCWPILKFGTEEQKQKYLVPLARGEKIGAFALTEPAAGTDASMQQSSAILEGDHYVLNGSKIFITSAPYADVFIVFAMKMPSLF